MEITTSTGVRGTALSGGPPTKATDDGSPPLTGKAPAEALSVGGEKPAPMRVVLLGGPKFGLAFTQKG